MGEQPLRWVYKEWAESEMRSWGDEGAQLADSGQSTRTPTTEWAQEERSWEGGEVRGGKWRRVQLRSDGEEQEGAHACKQEVCAVFCRGRAEHGCDTSIKTENTGGGWGICFSLCRSKTGQRGLRLLLEWKKGREGGAWVQCSRRGGKEKAYRAWQTWKRRGRSLSLNKERGTRERGGEKKYTAQRSTEKGGGSRTRADDTERFFFTNFHLFLKWEFLGKRFSLCFTDPPSATGLNLQLWHFLFIY